MSQSQTDEWIDLITLVLLQIVSVLAGTGACGIACMLTDIPFLQIGLLTVLMASGIGSNVLNTATVELYPTALR